MDSSSALPATTFSCTTRPFRQTGFKSLSEGETVEFTVTKGPKGWQAENVVKL